MTTTDSTNQEHLADWRDTTTPQDTVNTITGNDDQPGDVSREVAQMVYDNHQLLVAFNQIAQALNAANERPIQRTVEQGVEIGFRQLWIPPAANGLAQAVRICPVNYNRRRLTITTFLSNMFISHDRNVSFDATAGVVNGDASVLNYLANPLAMVRDFYTVRDMYVINAGATGASIGIQEEFFSGDVS